MSETGLAIGLIVIRIDFSPLAGDQRRRDAAIGARDRAFDAAGHRQAQFVEAAVDLFKSSRGLSTHNSRRTVNEPDSADALKPGPARKVIAIRHGRIRRRTQGGERGQNGARFCFRHAS
jgi:hypothetical protein